MFVVLVLGLTVFLSYTQQIEFVDLTTMYIVLVQVKPTSYKYLHDATFAYEL
jgi:hypothetical protein